MPGIKQFSPPPIDNVTLAALDAPAPRSLLGRVKSIRLRCKKPMPLEGKIITYRDAYDELAALKQGEWEKKTKKREALDKNTQRHLRLIEEMKKQRTENLNTNETVHKVRTGQIRDVRRVG